MYANFSLFHIGVLLPFSNLGITVAAVSLYEITTHPEKVEYRNMCSEIDAWNFRIWHKKADKADYAVEADGINMIVMGKKSQELKLEYGCPTNELLRDYLKKDHNEELLFLEKQNQVLLRMDMGYTERITLLSKMHEVTFKNKETVRVA